MPTVSQKAAILARAGVAVPSFPSRKLSDEAVMEWNKKVDDMFAAYAMSRAARSLREAEEAQQLSQLRNANAQLGKTTPGPPAMRTDPSRPALKGDLHEATRARAGAEKLRHSSKASAARRSTAGPDDSVASVPASWRSVAGGAHATGENPLPFN